MGKTFLDYSKKIGSVHWSSNLQQLNKIIMLKQYPFSINTDIMHKHLGNKFFTKLGIIMQYYTVELNEESHLCTALPLLGNANTPACPWVL
jgi:hypothetical protein